MAKEIDNEAIERGGSLGSCLMWFFWGGSMSFMAILSLVLLVLLAASVSLNIYLGWRLSGLEVTISRSAAEPVEIPVLIPTEILGAIPTQTPEFEPTPFAPPIAAVAPTETPAPAPTESPLDAQLATLSALATDVASLRSDRETAPEALSLTATPTPPPTGVPAAVALPTEAPAAVAIGGPISQPNTSPPQIGASEPGTDDASAFDAPDASAARADQTTAAVGPVPSSALTSSNSYSLIPINGEREQRPAEEHGDLNLKLREPQSIDVEAALVDAGAGVDPNAPRLGDIFEPNFTRAYAVHNWDWGCNCKADLIQDGQAVLVGIKTTPGEPIFIPPKEADIYDGKFYATVLYASENSLTFVYAREGTVAKGYTVHYLGLQTDPNLLKLFRESKGNELPGLTLDTPVGIATEELIVAIRDNGTFLDTRSENDWWK